MCGASMKGGVWCEYEGRCVVERGGNMKGSLLDGVWWTARWWEHVRQLVGGNIYGSLLEGICTAARWRETMLGGVEVWVGWKWTNVLRKDGRQFRFLV